MLAAPVGAELPLCATAVSFWVCCRLGDAGEVVPVLCAVARARLPLLGSRSPSQVPLGARTGESGSSPATTLGWLVGCSAHPSTLSISRLGNCSSVPFSSWQGTPVAPARDGVAGRGGCHLPHALPRMNQAPTVGFEGDVGGRTTHHFMYPESAKNLPANVSFVLVPFKALDLLWIASALSTGQIRL